MVFSCKKLGIVYTDRPDTCRRPLKAHGYQLAAASGFDQFIIYSEDGVFQQKGIRVSLFAKTGIRLIRSPPGGTKPTVKALWQRDHSSRMKPRSASLSPTRNSTSS